MMKLVWGGAGTTWYMSILGSNLNSKVNILGSDINNWIQIVDNKVNIRL